MEWEDGKIYDGKLVAIEAGRDDGGDNGDYLIYYDDGDRLWEPLNRLGYVWANDR